MYGAFPESEGGSDQLFLVASPAEGWPSVGFSISSIKAQKSLDMRSLYEQYHYRIAEETGCTFDVEYFNFICVDMQKHRLIRSSKSGEVISFGGEIQKRGILQDAFWELWWDSRKISLLTRFWIALCQQLSLFLETKTSIICDSSYWWWHGRNPICERPGTWYRVHA